MAISAINAAATYEAPKPVTEKTVRVAPVAQGVAKAPAAETQPIASSNGSEPSGDSAEQGRENEKKNMNMVRNAVSKANNALKQSRTKCSFSYHEATKRISIKIMDEETNEVIREIPPEETLEMVEKMWELAGIMVDERR
ncbi:MAG: flagellar protein FlaG [Lachnospiraceae bacterium]|nr:flagellar protein FlaG [Lachnospiraceae bacterium]